MSAVGRLPRGSSLFHVAIVPPFVEAFGGSFTSFEGAKGFDLDFEGEWVIGWLVGQTQYLGALVYRVRSLHIPHALEVVEAETNTAWFSAVTHPVCFVDYPRKATAVVYCGPEPERFASACRRLGPVMQRWAA